MISQQSQFALFSVALISCTINAAASTSSACSQSDKDDPTSEGKSFWACMAEKKNNGKSTPDTSPSAPPTQKPAPQPIIPSTEKVTIADTRPATAPDRAIKKEIKAGDKAMISAILATAPDQHPTEARFTKIPGSEIDVLVRCDEFPDFGQYIGCHKSYNAFIDWTGGAWNWNGWEFVLPAGGGHADYGGNELYVAKLVDKNGALAVDWSRPIDPQPLNDADCGAPISGPVASHTYAAPVYVEAHDEYWHVTTGGWPATTGCSERNQDKAPGMGGWVTDKVEWRKTHNATDHVMSYTQACYLRERDIIYVLRAGPTMRFKVHPKDNYRVENIGGGGWVNTSGHYDTAGDQVRNICYEYQPQVGIFGRYHGASGESEQVFQSKSKTLSIPSLSVEHSTGNLVAVGVDGYALHINTQTGEELDISAESGLKTRTATGKNIYGKFDMIEKFPASVLA